MGFHRLFSKLSYLSGGVDTGFHHCEPEAYISKLLIVKKVGSNMRIHQMPLARSSLNDGDCFILDAGLQIYTWFGSSSSPFEKNKCNMVAENMEGQRNSCTCN